MNNTDSDILQPLLQRFSIPELSRALFVVSHSGGKDSQAMYRLLNDHPLVSHIVIVHAELPGADWEETIPHIKMNINDHQLYIVRANKTFEEMVRKRGMWPSPKYRQCTSDMKVAPINKFIRHYAKDNDFDLVFNCVGLRAEESQKRKQKSPIKDNKKISNKKRRGYDFLPIHALTIDQVMRTYGESLYSLNQRRRLYREGEHEQALKNWPFSTIYIKGLTRHSCKLCIMASRCDLQTSAELDSVHYQKFQDLEKEIDHSFAYQNGHHVYLRDLIKLNNQTQLFKNAS